ncbi:tyrosyl-DNA phosphodiesterase 2-like [Diadema setosum]|uniref:tyrosyl-DNA phosphodiesterase 2-like n=1 Tax=Diadema setosum TaxID=31175 RepID=UPI003B3B8CFD
MASTNGSEVRIPEDRTSLTRKKRSALLAPPEAELVVREPRWKRTPSPLRRASASRVPPVVEDAGSHPVTPPKAEGNLRVITWNMNGLDARDTVERAQAVCDILKGLSPDVVFLQEVVPRTLEVITESMSGSFGIATGGTLSAYFTVALIGKTRDMAIRGSRVLAYPNSRSSRNLLVVQACFDDVELALMTSHLESMPSNRPERILQFCQVMREMQSEDPDKIVIFGGDTNLDYEVAPTGGVPAGIVDQWVEFGQEERTKFTKDTSINKNVQSRTGTIHKLRPDRVYLRPASESDRCMRVTSFELIGKERIPACNNRFPSNHWGVMCDFEVVTEKH